MKIRVIRDTQPQQLKPKAEEPKIEIEKPKSKPKRNLVPARAPRAGQHSDLIKRPRIPYKKRPYKEPTQEDYTKFEKDLEDYIKNTKRHMFKSPMIAEKEACKLFAWLVVKCCHHQMKNNPITI